MKYVIIGNSAAGVSAVEGIRSVDKEGEIVLISDEPFAAYGRPLISYYLLGATDRSRMNYRPADFYEKNKVQTMFGVRAERIDPDAHTVCFGGGNTTEYDKLLFATGSRAFVPPMSGIESVPERFTFMTMQDALDLEEALSPEKEVLIIGAGLIGLKCMEGILARVKGVAVVDLAPRILPSVLDAEAAAIVQRELEARGVQFLLSDSVARFDGKTAHLQSGRTCAFDILVVAVGVRPNVELVREAGGTVARGIVTDECQRTDLPDVFAAGDCTESMDVSSGTRRILALLPNACAQGFCAGVVMAGGERAPEPAIPLNAVGFFGSHILTAGSYEGECIAETYPDRCRRLFVKDGKLKGFILVNEPERAGIYTALIRRGTPLAELDEALLCKAPCLAAFSEKARAEMLAREV